MTKQNFYESHDHKHCENHKNNSCCQEDKQNQDTCCNDSTQHKCCKEEKNSDSEQKKEAHTCCKSKKCESNKEITQLVNEIEHLKEQIKDKEQKYLLSLAEAENSRKRLQKERQELTKYAVENILTEILYPMENLENALNFAKNMSEDVKNWAIGFEMILGQFKNILTENGVVEYTAIDQMFDPHLHEAVETVETDDYPEGFIIKEFAKGYKVGERPIRVAKVKVAKKIHQDETNNKNNQ